MQVESLSIQHVSDQDRPISIHTLPLNAFIALVAAALGLAQPSVQYQLPVERGLSPANAEVIGEFDRLHSLRELSDGRVLVGGAGTPALALVDFATSMVQPVGGVGEGPGEYQEVTQLLALGADTTLVVDSRSLRWIILRGATPVVTVTSWLEGDRGPTLAGADRSGHILELRPSVFGKGEGYVMRNVAGAESLLVLRHRRARRDPGRVTQNTDTIARLRGRFLGQVVTRSGRLRGAPMLHVLHNPLAFEDQALLFRDGWIALAHATPFRIEWIGPDGRRNAGPVITAPVIPVDETQKLAAMRRYGYAKAGFPPDAYPPWPRTLPPFPNNALHASPEGSLVIERTFDVRAGRTMFLVIDRLGRPTRSIPLLANQRLLGFGEKSVYVVETDGDGIQTLRRHPWP